LKVAAACGVEGAYRLLIRLGEVVEDGVAVGVGRARHRLGLEPEVQHARAGDGHLRHYLRVLLEVLEMLEHRMRAEADLAGDADALGPGFLALELDAVVEAVLLDALEHAEEIEMPPR